MKILIKPEFDNNEENFEDQNQIYGYETGTGTGASSKTIQDGSCASE